MQRGKRVEKIHLGLKKRKSMKIALLYFCCNNNNSYMYPGRLIHHSNNLVYHLRRRLVSRPDVYFSGAGAWGGRGEGKYGWTYSSGVYTVAASGCPIDSQTRSASPRTHRQPIGPPPHLVGRAYHNLVVSTVKIAHAQMVSSRGQAVNFVQYSMSYPSLVPCPDHTSHV